MSAAIKMKALPEELRAQHPIETFETVHGDGRAITVAKLRELADKLESGELDGAHVAWRDNHGEPSLLRTGTHRKSIEGVQDGFTKIRSTNVVEV